MPISDKQFRDALERINVNLDKLSERQEKINERIATLEGRNQGENEQKRHPLRVAGFTALCTLFMVYLGWLGSQIVTLDTQVAGLLAPQRLQSAASNPTDPKNVSQVTKILQDAQKRNQIIEAPILASVGAKFIEVSQTTPNAWNAAISLLDYRSFLNKDFVPDVGQLTPWKSTNTYTVAVRVYPEAFSNRKPPGEVYSSTISIWVAGGKTPDNKSARLEELDKPQSGSSDVAYFVVDGASSAAISLDGVYMRNVIIRNVTVVYNGGPLRLENVYFVNCKFQLDPTQRTKAFGITLLASVGVSFDGTET